MKQLNFGIDIADNNTFKSSKYQTKLLGNTEGDGDNGILEKNTTIAVPLTYLSSFWRSLEIALINAK